MSSGWITFTTDFGLRDSYVGQMVGAVLTRGGGLRCVDLCHEVPPGAIRAGGYVLETGHAAFPERTVHVAVVDPGVGTSRRAVAVRTARYDFVAPDNGLLDRVLEREPPLRAHSIEVDLTPDGPMSATFEGRDRFAPAGAWLALGRPIEELGPEVTLESRLVPDVPAIEIGVAAAVPVIWIDRFGNVALDVRVDRLERILGGPIDARTDLLARARGGDAEGWRRTFSDAAPGVPFLLTNSAGYLEIAARDDRADRILSLGHGDRVELTVGAPGARAINKSPR